MKPTNDEIREVLAEFMGWENIHLFRGAPHGSFRNKNGDLIGSFDLPDYTYDLNAMHEVEQELERRGLHLHYLPALLLQVGRIEGEKVKVTRWAHTHATASERARAAYAVIKAQQDKDSDKGE